MHCGADLSDRTLSNKVYLVASKGERRADSSCRTQTQEPLAGQVTCGQVEIQLKEKKMVVEESKKRSLGEEAYRPRKVGRRTSHRREAWERSKEGHAEAGVQGMNSRLWRG